MKTNIFLLIGVSTCMLFAMSAPSGRPWNKRAQTIPGRVECEFFDRGGEGISYHDTDSVNNGSGKLNPANGNFLNEFRMKEGVDISYTKSGAVDDHAYNKIAPQMNQLYVGWTQPGEWINYTVKVTETATYRVSTLYTANRDGMIGLSIDGKPAAVHIKISSTYDERDTVAWRQWHHWNRLDSLAEIKMDKGMHTLTLHIEKEGKMNFDYLEWKKK